MRHEAWTAYDAGMSDASDDDLAIYAHDKKAVLITHDREFSQRRRRNIIGRHIWLNCHEVDAADLIAQLLPEIEPLLERRYDLYIAMSRSGFEVTFK